MSATAEGPMPEHMELPVQIPEQIMPLRRTTRVSRRRSWEDSLEGIVLPRARRCAKKAKKPKVPRKPKSRFPELPPEKVSPDVVGKEDFLMYLGLENVSRSMPMNQVVSDKPRAPCMKSNQAEKSGMEKAKKKVTFNTGAAKPRGKGSRKTEKANGALKKAARKAVAVAVAAKKHAKKSVIDVSKLLKLKPGEAPSTSQKAGEGPQKSSSLKRKLDSPLKIKKSIKTYRRKLARGEPEGNAEVVAMEVANQQEPGNAEPNIGAQNENPPEVNLHAVQANDRVAEDDDDEEESNHLLTFRFRGFGGSRDCINITGQYVSKEQGALLHTQNSNKPDGSAFKHPVPTGDLCRFFNMPGAEEPKDANKPVEDKEQPPADGEVSCTELQLGSSDPTCKITGTATGDSPLGIVSDDNELVVRHLMPAILSKTPATNMVWGTHFEPFADASAQERANWHLALLRAPPQRPLMQAPMISSYVIVQQAESEPVIRCYFNLHHFLIVRKNSVCFYELNEMACFFNPQDMWTYRGSLRREMPEVTANLKEIDENTMYMPNTNIAYVEIWVKEYRATYRGRVCDIFAVIYFTRTGGKPPMKKVVHMENIRGFSSEIVHVVMKEENCIVIHWISNTPLARNWFMRSYYFSDEFERMVSIREFQDTFHTIQYLRNIDNCSTMICGCGYGSITLWNLQERFKTVTIDLTRDTPLYKRIVGIKSDRGIIYFLQLNVRKSALRLIGINAMNLRWKVMKTFKPPRDIDCSKLCGACMENGFLICCFEDGVTCWRMEDGVMISSKRTTGVQYQTVDSSIIALEGNRLNVQNVLTYIINTKL